MAVLLIGILIGILLTLATIPALNAFQQLAAWQCWWQAEATIHRLKNSLEKY